jgi:hypothetical protein
MKTFYVTLALLLSLLARTASAQITVPHTLADGETIDAARLNTNFTTIAGDACNRTGCTMTGTVTVKDVAAALANSYSIGTTGTRFQDAFFNGTVTAGTSTLSTNSVIGGTLGVTGASTLTGSLTANGAVDINSTFTIGSGNVSPFDSTGKIQAISSTYFASLSGTNLTGVAMLGSSNTFTAGSNNFLAYSETKTVITPSASMTIDLSLGSHFTLSNTTTGTMTFSNPPASGRAGSFTLAVTGNGSSHPITWPGSVLWAGNAAPTLTTTNNKVDFLTFITYDGGTTWYGFVGGQNF